MSTEAISSAANLWDAYLPGPYNKDEPPAKFRDFNLDPNHPDSYVSRYGAPAGFNTAPNALSKATFLSWNSQAQLEYIYKNLTTKTSALNIGTGTDTIDVMLSTVYNVEEGSDTVHPENPGNVTQVIIINYLTIESINLLPSGNIGRLINVFPDVIAELGLVTTFGTYFFGTPAQPARFHFYDESSPIARLYKFFVDISDNNVLEANITDAMEVLIKAGLETGATEADKNFGLIAQNALTAIKTQMDALLDTVLGNDRMGAFGVFSDGIACDFTETASDLACAEPIGPKLLQKLYAFFGPPHNSASSYF